MLDHPYYPMTYHLRGSPNISQTLKSPAYHEFFSPKNEPKLIAWISVKGYENQKEVLFLQQSIFQQLANQRLVASCQLFQDINIEDVANCIRNLQLVPIIHYETPIDNGVKERTEFDDSSDEED